jgi:2-polyprenyl-6-methoxyphenol hydroxylase-like FAD-dependent oxidoreductase
MILLPSAMLALDILGAKGDVIRLCRIITRTRVIRVNDNNEDVLDVPVDTVEDTMYCCRRTDLIHSLTATLMYLNAGQNDMLDIIYNKKCVDVVLDDEHNVVQLQFSNESRIDIRSDDLVIGADGAGSVLYKAMNPKAIPRPFSRVFELVTSTKTPVLARQLGSTFHKVVLHQYGLAMGLVSPSDCYVIGFIQFDTDMYTVPQNPTECRNLFRLCTSLIKTANQSLFAQYYEEMTVMSAHVWRPVNADMPNSIHLNNAILIGDAAHPLLPFTSCGVTTALDDGILLSQYLCDHANDVLQANLRRFSSTRRVQIQKYIDCGRKMLENFVTRNSSHTVQLPYFTEDCATQSSLLQRSCSS